MPRVGRASASAFQRTILIDFDGHWSQAQRAGIRRAEPSQPGDRLPTLRHASIVPVLADILSRVGHSQHDPQDAPALSKIRLH